MICCLDCCPRAGGAAYAISAIVSHYPWFSVYNFLSKSETIKSLIKRPLFRNGFIGMIASFVSDTVVNSIRVIKTTKQAMGARHTISYVEAINMVLAADGWQVRCLKLPRVPIVVSSFTEMGILLST